MVDCWDSIIMCDDIIKADDANTYYASPTLSHSGPSRAFLVDEFDDILGPPSVSHCKEGSTSFQIYDDTVGFENTGIDGKILPTFNSALRKVQQNMSPVKRTSRKKKPRKAKTTNTVKQKGAGGPKTTQLRPSNALSRKRRTTTASSINNSRHASAFSPQPRKKKPTEGKYKPQNNSKQVKPNASLTPRLFRNTVIARDTSTDSWPLAQTYVELLESFPSNTLPVYEDHPSWLYLEPKQAMYFLKCSCLVPPKDAKSGESFGFPRLEGLRKDYLWKKMSFTTDVPKPKPLIRYVTASCHRKTDTEKKCLYRLHAVMKLNESTPGKWETEGDYVLVDIRLDTGRKKRPGTPRPKRDVQKSPESGASGVRSSHASAQVPTVTKLGKKVRFSGSPLRAELAESLKHINMSMDNASIPKPISECYETDKSIKRPWEVKGVVVPTQANVMHAIRVDPIAFQESNGRNQRIRITPSPIAAPQSARLYAHNLSAEFSLACEEPLATEAARVSCDDDETTSTCSDALLRNEDMTTVYSPEKKKVYCAGRGSFHWRFDGI
jgi:hypothetical protein